MNKTLIFFGLLIILMQLFSCKTEVSENKEHEKLNINKTNQNGFIFRKTFWGMKVTQVLDAEQISHWRGSIHNQVRDVLFIERNQWGYNYLEILLKDPKDKNAKLYYYFYRGRLVKGEYFFLDFEDKYMQYAVSFKSIQKELISEHGKPIKYEETWQEGKSLKDFKSEDDAILEGVVSYYAIWEKKDGTIIIHYMKPDYFGIRHIAEFHAPGYAAIQEKIDKYYMQYL